VGGNPINLSDPLGLCPAAGAICVGLPALLVGGTATIVANNERPSWWGPDIPHPSDTPQETFPECPTSSPPPLTDPPPPPGMCAKVGERVGKACRSLGGSPSTCARVAINAVIACVLLAGPSDGGGMGGGVPF